MAGNSGAFMPDIEDEDGDEGEDADEDGGCGREEIGSALSDGIFGCDDDMAEN